MSNSPSTLLFCSGSLFARYTNLDFLYSSGTFALKSPSTFSSVFRVVLFSSVLSYLPSYRKVLPSLMLKPRRFMRFAKTFEYFFGKSFPITASNPVFVKKLAEMLAYVAAPPISHFSTFVGVLIVSKATEPNTTNMQNLLFIS